MMIYKPQRNVSNMSTKISVPNYDNEQVAKFRKNHKYNGVFKGEKVTYKIVGAYSVNKKVKNGTREDLILELIVTDKGYVRQRMQGTLITDDGEENINDLSSLTNQFVGLMSRAYPECFTPFEIQTENFDHIMEKQEWYPQLIGKTGNAIAVTYREWAVGGNTGYMHKFYFFSQDWLSITELEQGQTEPKEAGEVQRNAMTAYENFRKKCLMSGFDPNDTVQNATVAQAPSNPYGQETPKDGIPF